MARCQLSSWPPSSRLFGEHRNSGSPQVGKRWRPLIGRAIRTAQPDNTRRISSFAMAGQFTWRRRSGAVFSPCDSVELPDGFAIPVGPSTSLHFLSGNKVFARSLPAWTARAPRIRWIPQPFSGPDLCHDDRVPRHSFVTRSRPLAVPRHITVAHIRAEPLHDGLRPVR